MAFDGYHYGDHSEGHTQSYLIPSVIRFLKEHAHSDRIFEIGFGNGANARLLQSLGYEVTGIDPSADGNRLVSDLGLNLHAGSTDEDLAARFGTFGVVLSLEVIEHVFSPKQFAGRVHDLLEPGGLAIISTPYHGYLKNVALAVSGKMDGHFTALWEGGHIKFFSRDTMGRLFKQAGLEEVSFARVGRIPSLAKSMIGVYRKA